MQTKDKRERTKMKEEAKKTREWPWFVLVGLGKERPRFFRRSYIYIYIYICIYIYIYSYGAWHEVKEGNTLVISNPYSC
jgi:hypothetical protein